LTGPLGLKRPPDPGRWQDQLHGRLKQALFDTHTSTTKRAQSHNTSISSIQTSRTHARTHAQTYKHTMGWTEQRQAGGQKRRAPHLPSQGALLDAATERERERENNWKQSSRHRRSPHTHHLESGDSPFDRTQVVVLGGNNEAGSYLVPVLVQEGHEVVSVSNNDRAPFYAAGPEVAELCLPKVRSTP